MILYINPINPIGNIETRHLLDVAYFAVKNTHTVDTAAVEATTIPCHKVWFTWMRSAP